ncbi:MAG: histidine kinase dimerization/phospho-acceptor domain-containing protein, partial [Thermodesulfobacteriota bacterium]|nr:histidine kinase dimerization/phospho-acceptor domain-containing protein [Thermodesulfobacteriota bacterium]
EESLGLAMIINSDYSVSYMSPRLYELSGMDQGEVNKRSCYQVLCQREEPCEETDSPCPLRQVVNTGEMCRSSQHYLAKGKEESSYRVDCYPLRNSKNEVEQVLSILSAEQDANDTQSTLNLLYRLASIGNLLHGLAHNVNTPLSAVIARAEMLGERVKKLNEEQATKTEEGDDTFTAKLDKCVRDAEVIVVNAMKISGIIRNMMNKRLQEEEDSPQMLNLTSLLKEELQFLEADMTFKHEIQKTYNLDESSPLIKGVYYHFSQCFTNIINTIMKSFDGSDVKELTISSKHNDDTIYIEIHDTGLVKDPDIPEGECQPSNGIWLKHAKELLRPYSGELTISN